MTRLLLCVALAVSTATNVYLVGQLRWWQNRAFAEVEDHARTVAKHQEFLDSIRGVHVPVRGELVAPPNAWGKPD